MGEAPITHCDVARGRAQRSKRAKAEDEALRRWMSLALGLGHGVPKAIK